MALKRLSGKRNLELPGILCISHGPFAVALAESAEMIVGESDNLASLGLEPDDSPEIFKKELEILLQELPEETLILVDIFGGTPSNVLLKMAHEQKKAMYAVAGMNLPMLIDILNQRDSRSVKELLADTMANIPDYVTDLHAVAEDLMD